MCAFAALLDPEGGSASPDDYRQQSASPGSAVSGHARRQPIRLSNGATCPPPAGPSVTFVVGGKAGILWAHCQCLMQGEKHEARQASQAVQVQHVSQTWMSSHHPECYVAPWRRQRCGGVHGSHAGSFAHHRGDPLRGAALEAVMHKKAASDVVCTGIAWLHCSSCELISEPVTDCPQVAMVPGLCSMPQRS